MFHKTISASYSSVMLNRVILGSVIGRTPLFFRSRKNEMTEPRLPITLP